MVTVPRRARWEKLYREERLRREAIEAEFAKVVAVFSKAEIKRNQAQETIEASLDHVYDAIAQAQRVVDEAPEG